VNGQYEDRLEQGEEPEAKEVAGDQLAAPKRCRKQPLERTARALAEE